jgi:hypothetical protein
MLLSLATAVGRREIVRPASRWALVTDELPLTQLIWIVQAHARTA